MEVKELKEFIADRFILQDRIIEERFKNTDLQFDAVKEALEENASHHLDLKKQIDELQDDIAAVKAMEAATREREVAKTELEKYKAAVDSKYSLYKLVEKYPKIILAAIAVLTGFLMSGNIQEVLKMIFPVAVP